MKCLAGLSLLVFLLASTSNAASPPIYGRYLGVLHHDKLKLDQLVKLELIPDRPEGETINLVALLTLQFGDFSSSQYVTYRFSKVSYNPLNASLSFTTTDPDLSLANVVVSENQISAAVYSSFGEDKIGQLSLDKKKTPEPRFPLMPTVGGVYRCPDTKNLLQLFAFRSAQERLNIGNPFGAYEIRGRLGKYHDGLGGLVVEDGITSGNYNFFSGQLTLWGSTDSYTCTTGFDTINCGKKRIYQRETGKTMPLLTPPGKSRGFAPSGAPALGSSVEAATGQYMGYLHHEYLDTYQLGSLTVVTYPNEGGESGTVRLGATAKLFFGSSDSPEFLSYIARDDSYSLQAPHFLFQATAADAILEVVYLDKERVRGIWYSSLFGRVGEFEFFRDLASRPAETRETMGPIRGIYKTESRSPQLAWRLNLVTGVGLSSSMNPSNPIRLGGDLSALSPAYGQDRAPITGGSYDFYSGHIALLLQGDSLAMAKRVSQKELAGNWFVSSEFGSGFFIYRGNFLRE